MLVLTRRLGEEIVIGADTRVVVLGVAGQKVRFDIKAPPAVSVWRQELITAGLKPITSPDVAKNSKDSDSAKENL